jgi:hypothetical protein
VLTRTVAIAIRLTRRGVVTLGDYTCEGENGREVESEKRNAHRVDLPRAWWEVRTRTVALGLTSRGVITLGD